MTMPFDNVQAVIDTAQAAAEPSELTPGKVYAWLRPNGAVEKLDLTGNEYRDTPRRKTGITRVWDVAAFLAYYDKHADDASEVYADVQQLTVTAVLDAHQADTPRWGRHRLLLELRKTPEWVAWTSHDGTLMAQDAFAEHLEDHLPDLVAPPAAEMLEVAQSIQAASKVDFKSSSRLSSGQRQFEYAETTQARAGQKGQLTIPEVFEIGLVPFEGSAPYKVTARFRYRITDSGLRLGYRLEQPHNVLKAAFADIVEAIDGETGRVMNGCPA